jgi:hypothetical protein
MKNKTDVLISICGGLGAILGYFVDGWDGVVIGFMVGGVIGYFISPPTDKGSRSDKDFYGGDYGGGAGSMPG